MTDKIIRIRPGHFLLSNDPLGIRLSKVNKLVRYRIHSDYEVDHLIKLYSDPIEYFEKKSYTELESLITKEWRLWPGQVICASQNLVLLFEPIDLIE